jgi:hypothetical protein
MPEGLGPLLSSYPPWQRVAADAVFQDFNKFYCKFLDHNGVPNEIRILWINLRLFNISSWFSRWFLMLAAPKSADDLPSQRLASRQANGICRGLLGGVLYLIFLGSTLVETSRLSRDESGSIHRFPQIESCSQPTKKTPASVPRSRRLNSHHRPTGACALPQMADHPA